MWNTLPQFGTGVLCAILVAAAYTFAVSLAAGAGRPRLLQSARNGAYGTVALVGLAVLVLAYAFVSHDFRLDYVARYSDRTMTTPWLIAKDFSYYEMALHQLREQPVDLAAVYFQAIDGASHDLDRWVFGKNMNKAREPKVEPEALKEIKAGL